MDAKAINTGYMVTARIVLANEFQIGPASDSLGVADPSQTLLDVSGAATYNVPFHVRQSTTYNDTVATGYSITIAFTVTEK